MQNEMYSRLVMCLSLVAVNAVLSFAHAQDSPPQSDQARQVQVLVEKAAALINEKGKVAFAVFRKQDSEWRTGDIYFFGNDLNGIQILNPAFPEREGKDQTAVKDANGKPIFLEFKKVIQTKGEGWAHYMWPKPGQTKPSHKWSYLKGVTIDGAPALIGAGFYPE